MKKNVKSAKKFRAAKVPHPKKTKTNLAKFPQVLLSYMDAARMGLVVLCFFSYILVVDLNTSMVDVLSLNKDTRYRNEYLGV